jgi:hypothetical protein
VGPGSTLTLRASQVSENSADLCSGLCEGGGIQAGDGSTVVLDGGSVRDNLADTCAGIDIGTGSSLAGLPAARGVVTGNSASFLGGGVCAVQASVSYLNVTLNEAATAGGLDVADATVEQVEVRDNVASISGGGLNVSGDVLLDGCLVSGNEGVDSGGIHHYGSGTLTIRASELSANEATDPAALAGGVFVEAGTLSSESTDWATGAVDNTPHDVYLQDPDLTHDESGTASFVCASAQGTCQ